MISTLERVRIHNDGFLSQTLIVDQTSFFDEIRNASDNVDEHDYLQSLSDIMGMPCDSNYVVIGVVKDNLIIEYTTQADPQGSICPRICPCDV